MKPKLKTWQECAILAVLTALDCYVYLYLLPAGGVQ